jgi:hypothetical protein
MGLYVTVSDERKGPGFSGVMARRTEAKDDGRNVVRESYGSRSYRRGLPLVSESNDHEREYRDREAKKAGSRLADQSEIHFRSEM